MPGAHARELALLEVGVDPEPVRRHQRDELRADRRIGAGPRAAVADRAVDRRAQLGVAQVELRGVAVGDRAGQRRLRLLLLRVDDVEPALRRLQRRARLWHRRRAPSGSRHPPAGSAAPRRHGPAPGCDSDRRRTSRGRSRPRSRSVRPAPGRSPLPAAGGSPRDWPASPAARRPPRPPSPAPRGSRGHPASPAGRRRAPPGCR